MASFVSPVKERLEKELKFPADKYIYSWLRTCSSLLGVSLCPKAPIACVEWIIACLSDDKKRILSMKKTRLYQW